MKNSNIKRKLALISIIVIVLMIIATLVVACVRFPGSDRVFIVLIGLDVFIPVLMWMFLYIVGRAKGDDNVD